MINRIAKKLKFKILLINKQIYIKRNNLSNDNLIFTHMTEDEKLLLHKTLKSISTKGRLVCAEIGSYLGASSCFIANALISNSILYCIDTWGNHAMKYEDSDTDGDERNTYQEFIFNTKPYSEKIVLLRGWSFDVIHELKMLERNIDFLFIDGDHNYEGVKKDWNLYSSLFKKGTIIAFHDTDWADGVQRIIREEVSGTSTLLRELPNLKIFRII